MKEAAARNGPRGPNPRPQLSAAHPYQVKLRLPAAGFPLAPHATADAADRIAGQSRWADWLLTWRAPDFAVFRFTTPGNAEAFRSSVLQQHCGALLSRTTA